MKGLRYCPVCKRVTVGTVDPSMNPMRNMTGLRGENIWHRYCCPRPGGPEQIIAFVDLSVKPGCTPIHTGRPRKV